MSVPPPVPGPARDPARPSPDADRGGNGLAVAGFTLSVAGVVLGFSPLLSIAGLVCAVLGLVFSAAGRRAVRADPRRPHRGLAIAGTVVVVLAVIMSISGIVLLIDEGSPLRGAAG